MPPVAKLRVASPNDLNLGTLVTSEPRLNPGFTSWGDFVGSTVGRVQQTVIHKWSRMWSIGEWSGKWLHNIYNPVSFRYFTFCACIKKNTTFFFFAGAFPLQKPFHLCWVTAASFQCRTSLLYNKFFSKGASNPQPPSHPAVPVPCRAVPLKAAGCGFLRSPNCGNIQAEAREMSSKLSQEP